MQIHIYVRHQFLFLALGLIGLFFVSCSKGRQAENKSDDIGPAVNHHQLRIDYAKRFKVSYHDNYKLITLIDPWTGSDQRFYYALVDRGATTSFADSIKVIEVPVNEVVATSTTHLPAFEYLDAVPQLVGFPNTDLISSEAIREAVDQGQIQEMGSDAGMNLESLIATAPDLVIDYAMGNEYDKYKLVENIGIPVVLNADYMEETPLGRAEWIKFTALFLNKEKQADSIFESIKTRYELLQQMVDSVEVEATVFSGIVYGDIWYMPGGANFGAKFLKDAKADYLWSETPSRGFIQLSFESVYEKAHNAQYWIGLGGMTSLQEIKNLDTRYTKFNAFETGQVYNYNAKMGAKGGNAFLELGYLRPDIILADLIKILHPTLLEDHKLYFYQKLE